MSLTVSMSVGHVAVLHDIREEISANVDTGLQSNNEIFIDKLAQFDHDVVAYTNATFQPVIDEYNEKQKRPERKKTKTYVEYIEDENKKLELKAQQNKDRGLKKSVRKATKLCHEYVLQVGNRDTNGVKGMSDKDMEKNREYCRAVLKDIQQKYPHADILLATFHGDEPEGTPHMHILVQFVGEDYKQGLSKQISLSKALELDGLERSQNRGDYAINRWTKDIQDTIMTDRLQERFHESREILNEGRKHDDIKFFREKAKAEAEALDQRRVEAEKAEKELVDRHKELDESVTINQGLNEWYEGENDRLQTENDSLLEKNSSLQGQNNSLQGQNSSLVSQNAQLKEKLDVQQSKIELNQTKINEQDELISSIDNLTSYIAQKRSNGFTLENYTIEAQKSVFGQIKAPERQGVFVEGMTAEQLQTVFDRANANDKISQAYSDNVQAGQLKAAELLKANQDKIDQANQVLRDSREILSQAKERAKQYDECVRNKAVELSQAEKELSDTKVKISELETLKRQYDQYKQANDILKGELEGKYLRKRLKPVTGQTRTSYLEKGQLMAVYKDGTQRVVGRNEYGGLDDKTLHDQRAGLCEVGIIVNEPSSKVPDRLLNELISHQDPAVQQSADLRKFIQRQLTEQHTEKHLHNSI